MMAAEYAAQAIHIYGYICVCSALAVVLFDGSKTGHETEILGLERAGHSRHGLDHTGNECRLHLLTASSMEMPNPSFRISRPKILAAHIAPYSLAPESVTSKGSTWSEYQGDASWAF